MAAHMTICRGDKHMALSDKEHAWLMRMRPAADKYWEDLTAFEKKFIEDLLARFEIYDRRIMISNKQWAIIHNVSEKILP
jgi:hypothetical protein